MSDATTLRFVHISDTHISHDPAYNVPEAAHTPEQGARALVAALNKLPFTPDFVLHTGDVAYDPDPAAYETARAILSAINYPIYYVAGNHDDAQAQQRTLLGGEPRAPFEYEFEVKGFQIVTVDSNGPAEQPHGFIRAESLDRLRRIAADPHDPRPLVVAVHHNILPTGIPWWDDYMLATNGEAFHAALLPARHRLRGVFHGHVHMGSETTRDGILYSSVASSWYQIHAWPGQTDTVGDADTPPGYNVVTMTPTQTFIRRNHFHVSTA